MARPASQDPPKFLLRKTFQPSYENCAIFSCSLHYSCSVRKSFSSSMLQRAQFICLLQVSYVSYREQLSKQPTVSDKTSLYFFMEDLFFLVFFLFFFYNSFPLVYFSVWNDLKTNQKIQRTELSTKMKDNITTIIKVETALTGEVAH